jgi:hypothetical protein
MTCVDTASLLELGQMMLVTRYTTLKKDKKDPTEADIQNQVPVYSS